MGMSSSLSLEWFVPSFPRGGKGISNSRIITLEIGAGVWSNTRVTLERLVRDDEVGIETLQVSKRRGILKVEIETEVKDFE